MGVGRHGEGKGRLQDTAKGRLLRRTDGQATGLAAPLCPQIKPWGSHAGHQLKAAWQWVTFMGEGEGAVTDCSWPLQSYSTAVSILKLVINCGLQNPLKHNSRLAFQIIWVLLLCGTRTLGLAPGGFLVGWFRFLFLWGFFWLVGFGFLHCCLISSPSSAFYFPSCFLSAHFTCCFVAAVGLPMLCVQHLVSGVLGSSWSLWLVAETRWIVIK